MNLVYAIVCVFLMQCTTLGSDRKDYYFPDDLPAGRYDLVRAYTNGLANNLDADDNGIRLPNEVLENTPPTSPKKKYVVWQVSNNNVAHNLPDITDAQTKTSTVFAFCCAKLPQSPR